MESSKKYDLDRLRSDLRSTATEISALKRQMRRSHYNPTWQEYGQLHSLKLWATKLCCLRAHHRGTMHLSSALSPAEEMHVAELEPQYLLAKEKAA